MSIKHSFLPTSLACLFSLIPLLFIAHSARAESEAPQRPPTPTLAISSAQLDTTASIPQDTEVAGCNSERFAAQNAAFEETLIALVNEARAERNLAPLKSSVDLNAAARYHARDMAEDSYFEHHTYDWANGELVLACAWNVRIKGYYGDYTRLGENIARGYPTPESVFQAWMDSEGHRGNILHPDYREIGVGQYDMHWSQAFGEQQDVYPVVINQDLPETESQNITIYAYGDWDQVRLRNDDGEWSDWRTFSNSLDWTLPAVAGPCTVEAEMHGSNGATRNSDSINYVGGDDDDGGDNTPPEPHDVNALVYLPVVTR